MKIEVKNIVGGIVIAMIHKEMFSEAKSNSDRAKAIAESISILGKAFVD